MSHISKTNLKYLKFFKFLRDSCIKHIGPNVSKIIFSALLMEIPQNSQKIIHIWRVKYTSIKKKEI